MCNVPRIKMYTTSLYTLTFFPLPISKNKNVCKINSAPASRIKFTIVTHPTRALANAIHQIEVISRRARWQNERNRKVQRTLALSALGRSRYSRWARVITECAMCAARGYAACARRMNGEDELVKLKRQNKTLIIS